MFVLSKKKDSSNPRGLKFAFRKILSYIVQFILC